jgi:DNA-binding response OmpR family regulator
MDAGMDKKNLLVVEDEKKFRDVITLFLQDEGFHVIEAETGEQAVELFNEQPVDLVILDVMLPGMNGYEVCKIIRQTSEVPILFLTAMDDDDYYMLGYKAGADDYITKPFRMFLLAMKVKRILNRHSSSGSLPVSSRGIQVDEDSFIVRVDGEDILLTQKEFQLCRLLMKHEGRVLTRDYLLNTVWGVEYYGDTRVVDNHIKNLRKKLGVYAGCIKTVISVGYKYEKGDR